jgi:hypothetical protein
LKRWRRAWKIELIEKLNPDWRDLTDQLNPDRRDGSGSAVRGQEALHCVRDTRFGHCDKNEKGRALRTPSLVVLILSRATRKRGNIPTPPRAMTKLFDATCVHRRRPLETTGANWNGRTLAGFPAAPSS